MTSSTPGQLREVREPTLLADEVRRWMLDLSFPFWAESTTDPSGGFFERLDLDGVGIPGEDSRVRLQARMAYCFALACELGWDCAQAEPLAERGLDILVEKCQRPDGLYGKRVDTSNGLTDLQADAYDNAFALLAFATAARALDSEKAALAGAQLLQAIRAHLVRPGGLRSNGLFELLPAPHRRSQNPHMHMTEALLAWFEATREPKALADAEEIAGFVADTFLEKDSGLLFEFGKDTSAGNRVEVGHHYEWVWLLSELARLGGAVPAGLREKLFERATILASGLEFLPLSQDRDGKVIEPAQRTWILTEKLKAEVAMWRMNGSAEFSGAACATVEKLFGDHLTNAIPGAWIDAIDQDGEPAVCDITPATGYHLFLAFKEFCDCAGEAQRAQT